MKFEINLETIKEYLKRLAISVQSNSSRIEFTGVLINVYDDTITFEGRNDWMDTMIEDNSSSIKIIEPGRVLVKAQVLHDIVQKMEGQFVTFNKIDSNSLTIQDVDSKYELSLLDDSNFEVANYVKEFEEVLEVPSKTLREAIWKTAFAGKELHSKFIFQGLNISIKNGVFKATATDGIRVASWSSNIESNINTSKIIPLKVVKELLKILPDGGNFRFKFNKNKCVLSSDRMLNQFSLIEGTFPVFERFFSEDIYNKKIVVDKEVIINAIDRAVILTDVNADSAKIGLFISEDSFNLASKGEIGTTKIEVRGYDYSGDMINIFISPKILKDGIKHIDSDKLEILMVDPNQSALIKCEKDNFIYLVSPMI